MRYKRSRGYGIISLPRKNGASLGRPQFMLDNAIIAKENRHNIWIHTVNDFNKINENYRDAFEQLEFVLTAKGELNTTNFYDRWSWSKLFQVEVPKHYTIVVVFSGYPSAYNHGGDCMSTMGENNLRQANAILPRILGAAGEGWFDTRKEGNRIMYVLCIVDSMSCVKDEYISKMQSISQKHGIEFCVCLERSWEKFVESRGA